MLAWIYKNEYNSRYIFKKYYQEGKFFI